MLAGWPDRPGAAEHLLARHGMLRSSTLLAMGVSRAARAGYRRVAGRSGALAGARSSARRGRRRARGGRAAGRRACRSRQCAPRSDLPDRRLVLALARPPFRVAAGLVQLHPRRRGGRRRPELPEQLQAAAARTARRSGCRAVRVSPDAERLRKLGLDTRSIAAAVRAGELMRISEQVVLAPGADGLRPRCWPACRSRSPRLRRGRRCARPGERRFRCWSSWTRRASPSGSPMTAGSSGRAFRPPPSRSRPPGLRSPRPSWRRVHPPSWRRWTQARSN